MTLLQALEMLKTPSSATADAAVRLQDFIGKAARTFQARKVFPLSPDEVDDIQQITTLRVLKSLRGDRLPMDDETSVRAYIWKITENAAISLCREKIKDRHISRALTAVQPHCDAPEQPVRVDKTAVPHYGLQESLSVPAMRRQELLAKRATGFHFYTSQASDEDLENAEINVRRILDLIDTVFQHALSLRQMRWREDLRRAYDIAGDLLTEDMPIDRLLIKRGLLQETAPVPDIIRARDAALTAQKRLRESLFETCRAMASEGKLSSEEASLVTKALGAFRRRGECQMEDETDVVKEERDR